MSVATCHPNKVEVNATNRDDLTALDIFNSLTHEDENTRKEIVDVIKKGGGKMAIDLHDTHIHCETPTTKPSPSLLRHTFWKLWQIFIFNIRIGLTRPVLTNKDREICNTLMVVATLIAAMTFQGMMSPPGGLIQNGSGLGQAVLQEHLHNYLLYDSVAFMLSLIVILLTIYVVPRWKRMIKLAMITIWASVLYTTWSFLYGVSLVYPHLATNVWILMVIYFGGIAVLLIGVFLFIQLWYSFLLMALRARKSRRYRYAEKNGRTTERTIIGPGLFAILGAALVLILTISVTLIYHFFRDQQSYRSQLASQSPSPSP